LIGALVLIAATLLLSSQLALAQFTQQGSKLIGTGTVGGANQGFSVALSGDGNTAIVGGRGDNSDIGATWVYTRSGGVWSQQGSKLVANDAVGTAQQGFSIALSGDGNTAIVGGYNDNSGVGAAWVYTRSGGVWTQQGSKLVGTGAVGAAQQGASVALSVDGNTAIVGGYSDNSSAGAAWVYARNGGVWSQQGSKLVGTGAVGTADQGTYVALSGDGNTAIVGGFGDKGGTGAAWVFTLSGGAWSQQGSKLVANDAVGQSSQGSSVALSADGNTAIVGGTGDNSFVGASWVFTRSGGVWTQQGSKLVGTGAVGQSEQGRSVALSADGNTAIAGGFNDNSAAGASWVFTRSNGAWSQQGGKLVGTGAVGRAEQGFFVALSGDGDTAIVGGWGDDSVGAAWVFFQAAKAAKTNTHDFNGDGYSDILWHDTSGNIAMWLMSGFQTLSAAYLGNAPAWSIMGQRDFDGDGKSDILWHDASGNVAMWLMNGTQTLSTAFLGNVPSSWSIAGTGDFNGDGKGDILWLNTDGDVAIWLMNGTQTLSAIIIGNMPTSWSVVGTGDFNGDGMSDILWRNMNGDVAISLTDGTQTLSAMDLGNVPTSWSVSGTGDFNGDSKSDIVWSDSSNNVAIWLMNGAAVSSAAGLGNVATTWAMVQTGDYNGDGMSDLLWRDTSGNTAMWFMNGTAVASTAGVGNIPTNWTVQSVNAE
jgi:hypothetical protein